MKNNQKSKKKYEKNNKKRTVKKNVKLNNVNVNKKKTKINRVTIKKYRGGLQSFSSFQNKKMAMQQQQQQQQPQQQQQQQPSTFDTVSKNALAVTEQIGSTAYATAKGAVSVGEEAASSVIKTGKIMFSRGVLPEDAEKKLIESIESNITRVFVDNSYKFETIINKSLSSLLENPSSKEVFNEKFKTTLDQMIHDSELNENFKNKIENKILDPVGEYIHNQIVGIDPSVTKESILKQIKHVGVPSQELNGATSMETSLSPFSSIPENPPESIGEILDISEEKQPVSIEAEDINEDKPLLIESEEEEILETYPSPNVSSVPSGTPIQPISVKTIDNESVENISTPINDIPTSVKINEPSENFSNGTVKNEIYSTINK